MNREESDLHLGFSVNMQRHQKEQLAVLLSPLYMNLKRSEMAYRGFLSSGKLFCYAQIIFDCNTKIVDLLTTYGYLVPVELEQDALLLLEHLDVWKMKWVDHRLKNNPSADDLFHFENTNRFPRASAQKFEDAFHALRREYLEE